jgi:HEAT repeat protein
MSGFEAGKEKQTADDILELEQNKDIDGLIKLVKAGKHKYLKVAICALGELKAEQAIGLLVDLASKHSSPTIRSASIRALGEIGSEEAVETLIYVMLKDAATRLDSVEALAKIQDPRVFKPMKLLLEDESVDQEVREKIIEAFVGIGNAAAAGVIVGVLGDPDITTKASTALKELGKVAVEPLVDALQSCGKELRREIVILLDKIGDSQAVSALVKILKNRNEDGELRGDAAEALGRIGDYAATPVLINMVTEDEEYGLRCRSVISLGNLGDSKAEAVLLGIVQNKENPVRIRGLAVEALGKVGDQKTAEPLLAVLRDEREESWVKDNAIWAIGELVYHEAVPLIINYIRERWKAGDTDGVGRGAEALDKIGVLNSS